ncbi:Uncharacterised protein [Mycobacteroides abscessus subsp. abscessus]|nr:Uncharacterised protein [Mycobacteroides abscessus subsp. abscessus]SID10471.1 Uncharacterised protein [Mycobacteroides abscessus subsp. abscessus]SID22844.1 Uncharacterised protein [Mycobacteroides abscessus subsp. abscessus]
MKLRQPAEHRERRVILDAGSEFLLVVDEVPVGNDHTLRGIGRTRRVLQEGGIGRRRPHRNEFAPQLNGNRIGGDERDRRGQRVGPARDKWRNRRLRQHNACARVRDDAGKTVLRLVTTIGQWSGNRNHSGSQAAKKRRDKG